MNKDIILIIISTYLFIGIIHIIIIKLFGGYYARDFKGFWNTLGLLLTSPIIFIFVLYYNYSLIIKEFKIKLAFLSLATKSI